MAKKILFGLNDTQTIDQVVSQYDVEMIGMIVFYDEVIDMVRRLRPDALVLADNLKQANYGLMDVVQTVTREFPEMHIITVLSPLSDHLRPKLEEITTPVASNESLVEGIGQLLDLRIRPRGRQIGMTAWSLKGGVGKTTLNILLATTIKRLRPSLRVLLWDLDLVDGDASLALRLFSPGERVNTIKDILNASRIDARVVEECTLHHRSGIDVLIPPYRSTERIELGRKQFYQILDALKALRYNVIVFDLDCDLHRTPITTEVFAYCSYIFLVTQPNPFAVSAVHKVLPHFQDLQLMEKTYVIANEFVESDMAYHPTALQEHLQLPVAAKVPADPKIVRSQEDGVSLWDVGGSKSAHEIEAFVHKILTDSYGEEAFYAHQPQKKSLLGRFLSRER